MPYHTERESAHGNETSTVRGNETSTMHGNETSTMRGNETSTMHGNETSTMCGNETSTVHGNEPSTHLYPHEVGGERLLVGGANKLEDKVDDSEVVHSNLVLLGTHVGFHGDQSKSTQQFQHGLAKRSHLRRMELSIAHPQQTRRTIEPGGLQSDVLSHDCHVSFLLLRSYTK